MMHSVLSLTFFYTGITLISVLVTVVLEVNAGAGHFLQKRRVKGSHSHVNINGGELITDSFPIDEQGLKVFMTTVSGKVQAFYSYNPNGVVNAANNDGTLGALPSTSLTIVKQLSCNPPTTIYIAIIGNNYPNSVVNYHEEPGGLPKPGPCVPTIKTTAKPTTTTLSTINPGLETTLTKTNIPASTTPNFGLERGKNRTASDSGVKVVKINGKMGVILSLIFMWTNSYYYAFLRFNKFKDGVN